MIPAGQPAPGDAARELADRDQLERGFRRLSIDQRSVLVMHHYLGMGTPEIAETLGIPVGTVHSRLHYATSALRAVLEADARSDLVVVGGRTA
jgi:RNA polymerase sigma-70 factor (ECF subfamily)